MQNHHMMDTKPRNYNRKYSNKEKKAKKSSNTFARDICSQLNHPVDSVKVKAFDFSTGNVACVSTRTYDTNNERIDVARRTHTDTPVACIELDNEATDFC